MCLLAGVAGAATAADFHPEIELGVIRTDNLTLAREDPESGTIYSLRPSLGVEHDSRRIVANAFMQLEAYRYKERHESEVFGQFEGDLDLGLIPERLILDVGGSQTQVVRDPELLVPIDNLLISGNRVDRRDYYAGPSFQTPIGGNAIFKGELRRTWVDYADNAFDSYEHDAASLSVDNYRRAAGFTWAMTYTYDSTDYNDAFVPFVYQRAAVELGSWVTRRSRLFVNGGKESPWDTPLISDLEDSFWEAGFARQVGERFYAELAAGERTFGSSRRGLFTFNFEHGSTTITYRETPTNVSTDYYDLRSREVTDFLFRPGTAERYISSLAQWRLALNLRRTDVMFEVFDESRTQRTRADGTPMEDEFQAGAELQVTWRVGARTEMYLHGMRVDMDFASGRTTEVSTGGLGAIYRIGPRTRASLLLEARDVFSVEGLTYRANILSLTIARAFVPPR